MLPCAQGHTRERGEHGSGGDPVFRQVNISGHRLYTEWLKSNPLVDMGQPHPAVIIRNSKISRGIGVGTANACLKGARRKNR
jgi:hypothetical protein